MGNFAQDLKLGVKAQEFIVKELQMELPGLHSVDGNFSNYDLISSTGYTIEVKFDYISKNTANVGIEYEYNKKPSGIAKTKALDWLHIYFYKDNLVYTRVHSTELKAYIHNNWKCLKKVNAGDNDASKLVLINKEDFINAFGFTTVN
jgi:hypothetical protein